MRLAVLADVHDNLLALEAVVEDAMRNAADGFIAAGDYLMRGPFPQESVQLLRSLDARMVQGNTDGYAVDLASGRAPPARYTSKQWASSRWTCRHVDQEILDFLASLPEQAVVCLDGVTRIRVIHGAPDNPIGRLLPDRDAQALHWFRRAGFLACEEEPPALTPRLSAIDDPVVVCAHTHIPWSQRNGDQLVLNPGAVSGALNEDPRAQYALLTWNDDGWQVEHRAVEYDLGQLRRAYRSSGYLKEGGALARVFLITVETGRNVIAPFFSHIARVAAEAGCGQSSVIRDAVWQQAVDTFVWPDGS